MISEMFVTQENELLPASKKKSLFCCRSSKTAKFWSPEKKFEPIFFNQRMIHFFGFVFQNCFFADLNDSKHLKNESVLFEIGCCWWTVKETKLEHRLFLIGQLGSWGCWTIRQQHLLWSKKKLATLNIQKICNTNRLDRPILLHQWSLWCDTLPNKLLHWKEPTMALCLEALLNFCIQFSLTSLAINR